MFLLLLLLFTGGDVLPQAGVSIHSDGILKLIVKSSDYRSLPQVPTTIRSTDYRSTSTVPTTIIDTSLAGWGSGVHPTTKLCLNFLASLPPTGINRVCDYGCGSGVLAISARKLGLGSKIVFGVDIENDALDATRTNWDTNFPDSSSLLELYHVREVIPGYPLDRVDLLLANILIGALCRPSMVLTLVNALRDPDENGENGGRIVFSGIRPAEKNALFSAYSPYIKFDETLYAELDGSATAGSIDNYKFDVGNWACCVGRRTASRGTLQSVSSEMAIQ